MAVHGIAPPVRAGLSKSKEKTAHPCRALRPVRMGCFCVILRNVEKSLKNAVLYLLHQMVANLIGLVGCGIIVGIVADNKDKLLLSELSQIVDEGAFCLFVQITPGFIQQNTGGVTEQGASQVNFLLFTKGKVFRLDGYLLVGRRKLENGIQFLILLIGNIASADNVLSDRAGEDEVGVEKIAELRFFTGEVAGFLNLQVVVVDGKHARNDIKQGGLSTTILTVDQYDTSILRCEIRYMEEQVSFRTHQVDVVGFDFGRSDRFGFYLLVGQGKEVGDPVKGGLLADNLSM